jgi:hypothetical protein
MVARLESANIFIQMYLLNPAFLDEFHPLVMEFRMMELKVDSGSCGGPESYGFKSGNSRRMTWSSRRYFIRSSTESSSDFVARVRN